MAGKGKALAVRRIDVQCHRTQGDKLIFFQVKVLGIQGGNHRIIAGQVGSKALDCSVVGGCHNQRFAVGFVPYMVGQIIYAAGNRPACGLPKVQSRCADRKRARTGKAQRNPG